MVYQLPEGGVNDLPGLQELPNDCAVFNKQQNKHNPQSESCLKRHQQITDHNLDPLKHEEANINIVARVSVKKQMHTHAQQFHCSFEKASLKTIPCSPNTPSTATLTFQSHDGSPFVHPPSLISCKLSSPSDIEPIKCDINQAPQGEYNISFTPPTTGAYQLSVKVEGVDISGSPFTLPVIPLPIVRSRPVKTVKGLNRPRGITVCDNGDIVVAEYYAHCITIMNKEGKKVRSFGMRGMKEGQFSYPCGVAISMDGHILVTDSHRLQKLTFYGVCVKSVGSNKSGNGQLQFHCPNGIAVHSTTGQIFVVDCVNNRIQVFNNDLSFSHTIALRGGEAFNDPWDVSIDSDGLLYVAELHNHCITKVTVTGKFVTMFGSTGLTPGTTGLTPGTTGLAPGQLYQPSSLTIDKNLVYVNECSSNGVFIFDTKGTLLHCFGKKGSGGEEFNNPFGIVSDTNGNLYVSDTFNNRVLIF